MEAQLVLYDWPASVGCVRQANFASLTYIEGCGRKNKTSLSLRRGGALIVTVGATIALLLSKSLS